MEEFTQDLLLDDIDREKGVYLPILTACENKKGVLDVDTVKGCKLGMCTYSKGGCYGECYALKVAKFYKLNFSVSVSRKILPSKFQSLFNTIKNHHANWYRIGTFGDPCHDWENTIDVCERFRYTGKKPVIITKHWKTLSDTQIERLQYVGAIINTSTSGLDTDEEIKYRVEQINRLKKFKVRSICRVVTCNYGNTDFGKHCLEKQKYLLSIFPVIDNPLRVSKENERVLWGDIMIEKRKEAVGGGTSVSLHDDKVFLGHCSKCSDQCGYNG